MELALATMEGLIAVLVAVWDLLRADEEIVGKAVVVDLVATSSEDQRVNLKDELIHMNRNESDVVSGLDRLISCYFQCLL